MPFGLTNLGSRALFDNLRNLFLGAPQAQNRFTRTPMYFHDYNDPQKAAWFNPLSNAIRVSKDARDPANILHESTHAAFKDLGGFQQEDIVRQALGDVITNKLLGNIKQSYGTNVSQELLPRIMETDSELSGATGQNLQDLFVYLDKAEPSRAKLLRRMRSAYEASRNLK